MGAAVLEWRRRYVAEQEREQAQRQLIAEREAALAESATARRRLRRIRLIAAGMATVLLVMAGLGVVAYMRDREARQQRLLSDAAAALSTDPAASLARAAEAFRIDDDAEAREAVLVAASAPRSTVIAGPRPGAKDAAGRPVPDAVDMTVTPGGGHIVVFDAKGGIRVMDSHGALEAEASASGLAGHVRRSLGFGPGRRRRAGSREW